jgi:hypothetical protein
MGSMMGALSRLGQYTTAPAPVHLSYSSEWRDAMRAARMEANEKQPCPPALTPPQIMEAANAAIADGFPEVAAITLLTYSIGARVSDTSRLKREEITIGPEDQLVVQFKRGKGVSFTGPCTVHSAIADQEVRKLIQRQIDQSPSEWVWHCDSPKERQELQAQVLKYIRQAGGPAMRQSSIRRGALQNMVNMTNNDEDLMRFSGHARKQTLHRYLGWGKFSTTAPQQQGIARQHTMDMRLDTFGDLGM